MTTNDNFNNLIQNLTQDIAVQVNDQVRVLVAETVRKHINSMINEDSVSRIITECVNQNIDRYKPDLSVFEKRVVTTSENIAANLNHRADRLVVDLVSQEVSKVNIPVLVRDYVVNQMIGNTSNSFFPDECIPSSAINLTNFKISGDHVSHGMIQNFSSTGIDDQATSCRMTIMDQGVVFENTLYAPKLDIRGDLTVDGTLTIRGGMDADSEAFKSIVTQTVAVVANDKSLLDSHQNRVFERIQSEGIEIGKLKIGGVQIFEGQKLTSAIVNSQLETVGRLRDFQTQGESLLSETLYTTNRRVGINTMDPTNVLSIWDEEIEFSVGKQQKNIGRISTNREHSLVLGSNGHDNIVLTPDGLATVKKMKIGNIVLGSSPTPPSYDAPLGVIMFNENPSLGGPLGWVSLGQARWANFGIID
jgi:hypothetical protein